MYKHILLATDLAGDGQAVHQKALEITQQNTQLRKCGILETGLYGEGRI